MNTETLLVAAIGLPFVGGLLVLALPAAFGRLRAFTAAAAAALTVYCVAQVATGPLGRHVLALKWGDHALSWNFWKPGAAGAPILDIAFCVDHLAAFVLLAAAIIGFLVIVYAWEGLRGNARRGEFFAYALWALSGTILAVSADNLILMLMGWELVSVMLFYLVTIGGDRARYSAGKTLVMLGFGDAALLLAIVLLFSEGRTFSMDALAGGGLSLAGKKMTLAWLLIAAAALVKAGAMPLHSWIPKAAEGAPASTMALLPASIDKLLGIYLLTRASFFLFDLRGVASLQMLLMVAGAATVILAVMAALVQHDLRKLLAYHAVSQVGYMLLGLATGTAIGVAGALFHMLNNAIYKNLLFQGAGAIEKQTGTTELDRLGGLGRRMPLTFSSMLVASLSISGVPPFNGFISKWMIYAGLLQCAFSAGGSPAVLVFLAVAMFGSALTLASFVKVLHSAFAGSAPRECAGAREVGPAMLAPMMVLSAACVALGVAPYLAVTHFLGPIARDAGLPGGQFLADSLWGGLVPAGGGFWSPLLAAGLILLALLCGALLYWLGAGGRARVARPFVSGETTNFTAEETRFPGTGFYGTVMELWVLPTVYRDAAEGAFDVYEILGHAGERLVSLGRRAHDGVLTTYLSFCMIGLLAILAALLIPLLVGG